MPRVKSLLILGAIETYWDTFESRWHVEPIWYHLLVLWFGMYHMWFFLSFSLLILLSKHHHKHYFISRSVSSWKHRAKVPLSVHANDTWKSVISSLSYLIISTASANSVIDSKCSWVRLSYYKRSVFRTDFSANWQY